LRYLLIFKNIIGNSGRIGVTRDSLLLGERPHLPDQNRCKIKKKNKLKLILILIFDKKDVVTAMRFGVFGREDGSLVLIYKTKGIDVKML
jgi:hypothetical protein